MKYIFTFNETNYGSIEIEADHRPDNVEIIEKILEGMSDYKDTDFKNFRLVEVDGVAPSVTDKDSAGNYEVTITETLQKTVTVMATDQCEAEMIVQNEWDNETHILEAGHFKGVEFDAILVDA